MWGTSEVVGWKCRRHCRNWSNWLKMNNVRKTATTARSVALTMALPSGYVNILLRWWILPVRVSFHCTSQSRLIKIYIICRRKRSSYEFYFLQKLSRVHSSGIRCWLETLVPSASLSSGYFHRLAVVICFDDMFDVCLSAIFDQCELSSTQQFASESVFPC